MKFFSYKDIEKLMADLKAVRRLIYSTNAIEGFNRQLRKMTKSKTVLPSDDSLLKMLIWQPWISRKNGLTTGRTGVRSIPSRNFILKNVWPGSYFCNLFGNQLHLVFTIDDFHLLYWNRFCFPIYLFNKKVQKYGNVTIFSLIPTFPAISLIPCLISV